MFSAIPHLGAGYTSIMFTLSPVITLVLSFLVGVERPNRLGIVGIAVGFIVVFSRSAAASEVNGRSRGSPWLSGVSPTKPRGY
jgi:drug/metabolite transporter (DMT)-like permease